MATVVELYWIKDFAYLCISKTNKFEAILNLVTALKLSEIRRVCVFWFFTEPF